MNSEEIKELLKNSKMYTMPSNRWCMDIAKNIPHKSVEELISNCEKVKEYCKQTL